MQALLQDPRYVAQEMRRQAVEDQAQYGFDQDIEAELLAGEIEDDEPDILTGYEVVELQPFSPPEDSSPSPGEAPPGGALMGEAQPNPGTDPPAPVPGESAQPTAAAAPQAPQPQSPATGGPDPGYNANGRR